MNKQFTEEQIKVYASSFRKGDAIWADGKWNEVVENEKYGDDRITAHVPMNSMVINIGESGYYGSKLYEGVADGFKKGVDIENPYRVTTLDDYELQGGEKLVRLKYNCGRLTVGKSYILSEVKDSDGYYWIIGDGGDKFYIHEDNYLENWGIIPRYEQVKSNPKRNVSDEEFDNFLNDLDKTLAPVKKDNQLEHVVHYPTAADREEEILKIKTFDLLNHDISKEEIITDLKEIAHIEINNGNYDIVNKVVELVKEWEGMK